MGMAGMMGVDSVESSNRQKAMKNRIDKGVAGRSMMAMNARVRGKVPARQRPALETLRGVEQRSGVQALYEGAMRGVGAVENEPTRGCWEVKRAMIGVAQAMLAGALVTMAGAQSGLEELTRERAQRGKALLRGRRGLAIARWSKGLEASRYKARRARA